MKADVLFELLENCAEQLGVRVSVEPLQTAGTNTGSKGGLCRVKGQHRVIIDKRATGEERVMTLATALATFDTSQLELSPKVRETLRTHEPSSKHRRPAA